MRAHIIENGVVKGTIEVKDLSFMPGLIDAALGGVRGDLWDGSEFTTPEPEPEPEPVELNILLTDTWTIPADGITIATVTYTSDDTVYFAVNDDSHVVDPVSQVATLEITADAPGPIQISVRDKRLLLTATDVVNEGE